MNAPRTPPSASRLLALLVALVSWPVMAADWSDTYLGFRYGTAYRESYVNKANGSALDISKSIVNVSHTSGYKYGINWFNVDFLMSDHNDAAYCSFNPFNSFGPTICGGSAQETYFDYRHHLEWGKVFGKPLSFLFMKDLAFTIGYDWNTKTDAGYNSKQRRWVWGPTLELEVPGYMNVGFYGVNESNQPCAYYQAFGGVACTARYTYKTHAALMSSWAIPIFSLPLSYEGYANIIAAKGTTELGNPTKPEINFDSQVMADIGSLLGAGKNTFKFGVEYQYWRNKYGNDHTIGAAAGGPGPGAFARTPQLRVEYHF